MAIREKLEPILAGMKDVTGYVIDICFDYKDTSVACCKNFLGLAAIRILLKGKKTEEQFEEIHRNWKDEHDARKGGANGKQEEERQER